MAKPTIHSGSLVAIYLKRSTPRESVRAAFPSAR